MSNVEGFYNDCLGCGLEFEDGVLQPALSPFSLECTPDGIDLINPLTATDNDLTDALPCATPFYYPTCDNPVKWDCSTGQVWAPPGPCRTAQPYSDSGAVFNNISGVLGTDIVTVNYPDDDCDNCRVGLGYRTVVFGMVTIRNEILNTQDDPLLTAFQSDAEFTINTGGGTQVYFDIHAEAWFGHIVKERAVVFNFPVNFMSTSCGPLSMTFKGGINSSYNGSPSVTVGMRSFYSYHLSRMLMPRC